MDNELILLGKRIAELRTKRGYTQEKLAEATGYSTNHIAKLESARTNPSYELVIAIARTLNVETKELFSFDEQKSPQYIRNVFEKIVKNADDKTINLLYKFYNTLIN